MHLPREHVPSHETAEAAPCLPPWMCSSHSVSLHALQFPPLVLLLRLPTTAAAVFSPGA